MSIMIESLVSWPYNINMKRILILLISITIISCSNLSLETEPIIVNAVDHGKIFRTGDTFDISFNKSSDSVIVNPTRATVIIVYQNNNSLEIDNTEITIEPKEYEIDLKETPNPQFRITSDLEQGLYSLLVTVYENDSIISEYESEFIVYSGELHGEVYSLSPSKDLYTNSMVILESKISHEDSIDPYLIWKFEDTVFHEGYLSEGADRVIWDTADRYGFMDIKLEMFPYRLNDILIESEKYVNFSFIINPIYKALFDDITLSPYSKAMYFNGNYIDELNKELEITQNLQMKPNILNNYYGMELGPDSWFTIDESIFPMDSETEETLSFSVIMDFMPILINNGSILKTSNNGNSMSLFVQDGVLKHSFGLTENETTTIDIKQISALTPIHLVISFIKFDGGYKLLYYSGGELLTESFWILNESESNLSVQSIGSTTVGGFSSIIDSFEIYYNDLNDLNNIYPNHLKDRLGIRDQYKILDGFNSLYNPVNLIGDGISDGEYLLMSENTTLDYTNILNPSEDYTVEITASIESNYILSIFNESGTVINRMISGFSSFKKVGNTLFINDEKVLGPIPDYTGFKLDSLSSVKLDSITVLTRDTVVGS